MNGSCQHIVIADYCLIEGECYADQTLNPAGGCSVCDASLQPESWTLGGDATCDDGDSCTYQDSCTPSGCSGVPIPCEDGDPCTLDGCADGACVFTPDPSCGSESCVGRRVR